MKIDTLINPDSNRRLGRWIPAIGFLIIIVLLGSGLFMDLRNVRSPLIGKPVPDFQLPAVKGRELGLASTDLKGEVSLVNVFASWCASCLVEHPLFMRLAKAGTIPIHGINYKDKPDDAAKWLDKLGDPYTRTGADLDGRVGFDWGVYGVPETYLVDREGTIVYKHIGPISKNDFNKTILPLIQQLR